MSQLRWELPVEKKKGLKPGDRGIFHNLRFEKKTKKIEKGKTLVQ